MPVSKSKWTWIVIFQKLCLRQGKRAAEVQNHIQHMMVSNHFGSFLGFLCQSVPCLSKGRTSWTTYFHLLSIDYKEAFPVFSIPLTKMSSCSAGDRWQQSLSPEEFLSCTAAKWRSALTLAKLYVLGTAHRSDTSFQRSAHLIELRLCFLTAGHLLREHHTDLSEGKIVAFTIVTLQDAIGEVGSAVWAWKCRTDILSAEVGAWGCGVLVQNPGSCIRPSFNLRAGKTSSKA